MVTKQLLISGKVQGVFYRKTAKEIAEQLKLTGWIKNEHNGNVLTLIQGEQQQLDQFISWCYKGTENAKVTNIEIVELVSKEVFTEFSILH